MKTPDIGACSFSSRVAFGMLVPFDQGKVSVAQNWAVSYSRWLKLVGGWPLT